MIAIAIMGMAAVMTIGCLIFTIYFCITTYIDTIEFRRSLDSNFLKSEKEVQTLREFKSYSTLTEDK